jgi:hypothetical protein
MRAVKLPALGHSLAEVAVSPLSRLRNLLLACAALLAFLALGLPASAQAFSIGHAGGAPSGARIVYHIEVCGLKHARVGFGLFVIGQEDAATTKPPYERRWAPRKQRYYCTEWSLEINNLWPRSEWVASQLAVFDYTHRHKKESEPFLVVTESLPEVSPREPYDTADYPVTCADGWTSPSGGDQGACSHHGGVA